MLARLHLAGRSFEMHQPNLRGLAWWNETVPVVLPYLSSSQHAFITQELAYQNHVAARSAYAALPRGAIHADLFRDNVLFDTVNGQPVLSGFFDFYFAGVDTWLFDLAVCLNDWCIELETGVQIASSAQALIAAYESVRPLVAAERELLPAMLRAGALRFWLSRLWDFYLPREASMLQAHDPGHFERVLRQRVDAAQQFKDMAVAV
jgi:homoserine kinase type II